MSALGYEHDRAEPVIRLGDETRHVGTGSVAAAVAPTDALRGPQMRHTA